ncbi:DUF2255 family protein [Gordonia hydrophobica]|uniref:DUF2255 family protein n=1 Tax=Gordonia hydrophobica TaxID=40516 RepID=A0ABZ2U4U9_9ACTN|nr:DUF2255 family protein [Gordonia hydrophobica]MBM7369509.1 hypothetical protein [Gordonia hydrophobica]
MGNWTAAELAEIDAVSEIQVAGSRRDGSLRSFRIIWHVAVDGALYARSVNGPDAAWYVGVRRQMSGAITWNGEQRAVDYVDDPTHDDAVDEAFRRKYGNGSPTQSLNRQPARGTTLRIDPK